MKVKNLYEINTIDVSQLWTHKFYVSDEEVGENGIKDGDYFLLLEPDIQVECRLRDMGLTGEEKEKKRIELLREYMGNPNRYNVECFIKMYQDSNMSENEAVGRRV